MNELPRCRLCLVPYGVRHPRTCPLWDVLLTEADWRRLHGPSGDADAWKETARQADGNAAYYRGLLDEIAVYLGQDAYIADDGTRSQDPLRAKLPELVEALVQQIKPLTGQRLAPETLRRLRDIAELMDQCGAFTDSHGEQQDHADDAAAIRAALAALLAPAAKPDWQAVRSTPLLGGTSLTARDCYVIGIFCDEVERMAERNMIKTGKLEGAHYAAMRQLRATFPTPNAGGSGGTPSAEGDGSPGGAE